MQIVVAVLSVLSALFGVWYGGIALLGLFRGKKPRREAPPQYKIAALIAARNEGNVIAQAVESVRRQRYPDHLTGVFVAVNNCTDDTEAAARAAGAEIIRCQGPIRSKGDALRFAFSQLLSTDYDAYVILDADNLADPDFFSQVNLALADGCQVAQGYRDSKNPGDGWVAADTSVFYWFMSSLFNRSRAALGMSANLNGTGFMVSARLLCDMGWNTGTLTEDLEFSAQCALRGEKIGWMEYARVYDDQPVSLWDSMVQRKRWYAGSLQCWRRYFLRLCKKRTLQAADMAILFFGNHLQYLGVITLILSAILSIRSVGLLASLAVGAASGLASAAALDVGAWAICRLEKKKYPGQVRSVLLFFFYMLTWMFANLSVFVTGMPKWKVIKHKPAKNMDMPV